jgi:hypothetical protein
MRNAPSIEDELHNTLKLTLHCAHPSPSVWPEVKQVLQQLQSHLVDVDDDGAKQDFYGITLGLYFKAIFLISRIRM